MKRWALLTVGLYVLCILILGTSMFLYLSAAMNDEVSPLFYVFFAFALVLVQVVLLLVPVAIVQEKPIKRRKIVTSAIIGAIPMGAMALGFFGSIILMIWGENATAGYLYAWPVLFIPAAFWLLWGSIFYRSFSSKEPNLFTPAITRWLLKGSILELLVAIPSHIISRQRNECCAPPLTLIAIVTGLSVALMSFGPGIFFLFVKRIKDKKGKQYKIR
ncbi:MAG: hypothetical protein U9R31_01735 [Candidatus Omnitrophota bacterium]|nr:hypothetical protein [Candidatus Omnitrophota bacterium]